MIRHQRKKQSLSTRQNKPVEPQELPLELTFLEHVYELRNRIFWVILALTVTSAAAFQFKDPLIAAVMAPLHGQKLIYLTPGGGFSFIFTLCLYVGALFTIPFAIYHIYHFLQPIIGRKSRRFVVITLVVSSILAASGALFGYFVTVPAALNFLSNFAGDTVVSSLTADSYLGFVVAYVLGLAVLFQLPLLLFMIDHINPLKPGALSSSQDYVIIGATALAAVITPTPDVFNMALVAVPIVAIYEIGALAVVIRRQHRKRSLELSMKKSEKGSKKEFITKTSTILDEPFLSDIDDLLQPAVKMTPSIKVQVARAPVQQHAAVAQNPPTKSYQQQTHKRTLDGFAVPTRREVHARMITSQRPERSLTKRSRGYVLERSHRTVRTIDGLSIASPSM